MRRNVVRTTAVATGAAAAETVVATIGVPNLGDNPLIQGVTIQASLNNLAPGAGTTAGVIRVRKGTVAGTQVGVNKANTQANGTTQSDSIRAYDPAPVSGQVYVITYQQTGGTGAGTIAEIIAEVTSG
jgi:hypothetical protein